MALRTSSDWRGLVLVTFCEYLFLTLLNWRVCMFHHCPHKRSGYTHTHTPFHTHTLSPPPHTVPHPHTVHHTHTVRPSHTPSVPHPHRPTLTLSHTHTHRPSITHPPSLHANQCIHMFGIILFQHQCVTDNLINIVLLINLIHVHIGT